MSSPHGKLGLAGLLLVAVLLLTVSPSVGGTIVESFDNNQFNQDLFIIHASGVASAKVTSGQLEVSVPGNPGTSFSSGNLHNNFNLVGDFDMQVDFTLPTWSPGNGVNAGIVTLNGEMVRVGIPAGRNGDQPTDTYLFYCKGYNVILVNTTDRSGKLRLKRTGNTVEGSYWNGAGWQVVGSHTDPQLGGPSDGSIGAYSGGYGQSQTAQATFDNYQITYTKITFGNKAAPVGAMMLLLD